MRVLLVNPYYPISETPSPPLGLACIASILEKRGIEVKILDFVVFPYSFQYLETVFNDYKPDILGLTAVTMTFNQAIRIVREAKAIDPNVTTVMGGPHVSFQKAETMNLFPELDIIAMGEGDDTLVDIIGSIERKKSLFTVKGIVFRNDSTIASTGQKDPVNLDSLPLPSRHLLPLGRYKTLGMPISMTTSRGCPYQCIFCAGRKMVGSKIRFRNPGTVSKELGYLDSLNFHQINIADDLFTAKQEHCLSVCAELIKKPITTKWTSFARVDTISQDLLEKMKEAGCVAVSFGVESGNSGILKTIKKGIKKAQVITAVKMCKKAGIAPHASFILGLPGETSDTLKETINFTKELKDLGLSSGFHLLTPFPGTDLRNHSNQYDIKILTNDWTRYHANRAVVETAQVSKRVLDDIIMAWEDDYHAYLSDIKTRMRKGQASKDESSQIDNLDRIALIYDLMMSNALDEKGEWKAAGDYRNGADDLKILAKRMEPYTRYTQYTRFSRPKIFKILEHARKKGSLKKRTTNGMIKWEWEDYL